MLATSGPRSATSTGLGSIYRHVLSRSESSRAGVADARLAMNIRRHSEPPADKCPVSTGAYERGVLRFFERKVHEAYVEIVHPEIVLHAAGVALAGRVALLPGTSGSGKTTLTGVLIRRGMDYLGDELVCLRIEERGIRTMHHLTKALSVKERSFSCFAGVLPCASSITPDEVIEYYDPDDLRPNSVAEEPLPVTQLVFPRFRAGARCSLIPLSRGETVLALNGSSLRTGLGIDPLVELARRLPAHRLEFGRAEDAAEVVHRLLAMEDPVAARSDR